MMTKRDKSGRVASAVVAVVSLCVGAEGGVDCLLDERVRVGRRRCCLGAGRGRRVRAKRVTGS